MVHTELPAHEVVPHAVLAICSILKEAIAEHGSALVGVTGSPSMHELYANLGRSSSVDWKKVVFFAVDDTFVPGCSSRGGGTRQAVDGAFDWPEEASMIFPGVSSFGVAECCRVFEDALENVLRVPDVVLLTVESNSEVRCAGIAAPIPAAAFSKERLCVVSHTPLELDPYTISASISFLRQSRRVIFVLPTIEQSELWATHIVNGLNENSMLTPADRVREYAAVSLIGHRNVSIIAASTI